LFNRVDETLLSTSNQSVDSLRKKDNETPEAPKDINVIKKSAENVVSEIQIRGNKNVSKALILNEVTLRVGSKVNPYLINRSIKNIQSLGIFENVFSDVQDGPEGKIVVFEVKEFPVIKDIELIGVKSVSPNVILEAIPSKKGEIFNTSDLRRDLSVIQEVYEQKNFIQARVIRVKVPYENDGVYRIEIGEGIVEEVLLTGNTRTQDYVILREMVTKPGDALNSELLREDLRRIFNLNYFEGVEPHFLPGDKTNQYKLEIDITERPTSATFTFGGTYSPTYGFSVFSDLFWDNFAGTGQLVMLKGSFGRSSTYQLKYHNPWMWDDRKSLTLRTWHTAGDIGSILNTGEFRFRPERRIGFDAAIGIPLDDYNLRSSHKFKYENVELDEQQLGYQIYSYTFGLTYDSRDVWFNPREGEYISFSAEKGFKLSDTALDFIRLDTSIKKFIPTFEKQTIALRLDTGYITSPQIANDDIFATELYRVGGGTSIRGYSDSSPIAYGNKKVLASLEYRWLFTDTFSLVAFMDAGFAPNLNNPEGQTIETGNQWWDFSKYKVGKGIGLRFTIPGLGPLRLDGGVDDLGITRIHFSIGHAF